MKFTTAILSLTLALTASAARRAPRAAPKNLQDFDGVDGGEAPTVTNVGGDLPYQVATSDPPAFSRLSDALLQSCYLQDMGCAALVVAGQTDLELVDCQDQSDDCVRNVADQ